MSTFIDIHAIQDLPPSNVNRDDSGMPKSALYGGVPRVRVSSQSWKKAIRDYFRDHIDKSDIGCRTLRVVDLVAEAIKDLNPEVSEEAEKLAGEVLKAGGIKLGRPKNQSASDEDSDVSGYLLFLSPGQVRSLAQLAIDSHEEGVAVSKKDAKAVIKQENSIDIALFGRMVADKTDLNVDAACQVAHAISTHRAENEFDFFTAVDDFKQALDLEDSGAGMMGTVGFSSATMYRYANINVDLLRENLGDNEVTLRAITSFVQAFARSMPTGKINTFANRTLPTLLLVSVREDQPISLVSAFEEPITSRDRGYSSKSLENLANEKIKIEKNYGEKPLAEFVISLDDFDELAQLGERTTLPELTTKLRDVIAARLPETK